MMVNNLGYYRISETMITKMNNLANLGYHLQALFSSGAYANQAIYKF